MATTPIIGTVTVGGTSKTISSGYVNIGGVWKPIAKTYVNVNGVWKNAWKDLYTWKKYTVTTSKVYSQSKASSTTKTEVPSTEVVYYASAYTFSTSTGKYTLTSSTKGKPANLNTSTAKYFIFGSRSGDSMCELSKKYLLDGDKYQLNYYLYTTTSSNKQVQGTYIEDVTSENASAYPTNGKHTDGYWYVKQ